jgi:hypothetical protein
MPNDNVDVTAIRIHLNELRSQFDDAMRHGEVFGTVKDTYLQIKELECHLKAMEWDADRSRARVRNDEWRYRHVDEPPPLL